jgi:hypothetical protein
VMSSGAGASAGISTAYRPGYEVVKEVGKVGLCFWRHSTVRPPACCAHDDSLYSPFCTSWPSGKLRHGDFGKGKGHRRGGRCEGHATIHRGRDTLYVASLADLKQTQGLQGRLSLPSGRRTFTYVGLLSLRSGRYLEAEVLNQRLLRHPHIIVSFVEVGARQPGAHPNFTDALRWRWAGEFSPTQHSPRIT